MKKFTIKITDTDVYLNGERCYFAAKMDKDNHEDDLNKKALLALANEMGYEAQFLFEEMADRLDEMLDESYDDLHMQEFTDDSDEMIDEWLNMLLESTGKNDIGELSSDEILAEIDDVEGTISNEEITVGISEFAEDNIRRLRKYLKLLQNFLTNNATK